MITYTYDPVLEKTRKAAAKAEAKRRKLDARAARALAKTEFVPRADYFYNAASVYEHAVTSEEARKADLLPTME